MGDIRLNKWQRLVIVIGAIICLLRAYYVWQADPSDGHPGSAFITGVVLLVLSLSSTKADDEPLPFVRYVLHHKRVALGIVGSACLVLIVLLLNSVQYSEEAAEMPDTGFEAGVREQAQRERDEKIRFEQNLYPQPVQQEATKPGGIEKVESSKQSAQNKLPSGVGDCLRTSIKEISSRLQGVPESGSAIEYENGIHGVDYEVIPSIGESRAGDPITLCLTSVPRNCPAGDDRGKVYSATNNRTRGSWSLPDSSHQCGGA